MAPGLEPGTAPTSIRGACEQRIRTHLRRVSAPMSLRNALGTFADTATLPAPLPWRAAMRPMPARVLVLFGADWDARLLPRYERSGRYRFHAHGFDLFRFPSNARLMW